jgi:hypothetical protein
MSYAPADSPDEHASATFGAGLFPWVLSSTLHTLTLLALAIAWPLEMHRAPAAAGISLEASLLSSTSAQANASTVRVDAPPADGYYDDEPATAERESQPGETGGSAGLAALLNEKPAVSLAGVLPASAAEAGTGGEDAGVGSASAATGQPPAPNRSRGGIARTGVFGVEGEGYKFVYVFDRSGSMDGHGGTPLVAAKNELIGSLGDLGQTHQFQIIFYNEEPRIFNPAGRGGRLVFGTEQNKNLARRFVGSITASGATRHLEALLMALQMAPDVIFFLTDADEPRMSPADLARIAQLNEGTTINAIEFGHGAQDNADNFLVTLARQNGGKHVYIDVSQLMPGPR